MAANDTAALVVALSAQLTKFEKDMDNAAGVADRGARKIEERFSKINPGASFVNELESKLTRLATVAGVGLLIDKIHELNAEVAKIGEASERVGLSTDEFQKFRYAIVATGGSAEVAEQFLDTFSRKIAEAATGTGSLYKFLRVNNVALKDAQGQLLPLSVLLGKYADLVRNTKSPQDQLNETFMVAGRALGPQIVSALRAGSEGLQNFANQAQQSGTIIDRELIERARIINTEYQKLKLQFNTTAQEVAVGTWDLLARSFNNVAGGIKEFLEQLDALKRFKGNAGQSGGIAPTGIVPGVEGVPDLNNPFNPQAATKVTVRPAGNVPLPQTRPGAPGSDLGNDGSTKQYNAQAEALNNLISAQEQRVAILNAERDAIGKTIGIETEEKTRIDLTAEAKRQKIALTPQVIATIDAEAKKVGDAAQSLDDYKRRWQGINSAIQFGGDQVIDVLDGIRNKTLTAGQAVTQLGNAFIHAAEQALLLGSGPLAGIFGTATNVTGGTGGLFGALASAFGGARASGGPVNASTPYLVGEHGPELFIPKGAGNIVPNGVTSKIGAGGLSVVIQQDISLAPSGIGAADQAYIQAQLAQTKRETISATIQAIQVGRSNNPNFLGGR